MLDLLDAGADQGALPGDEAKSPAFTDTLRTAVLSEPGDDECLVRLGDAPHEPEDDDNQDKGHEDGDADGPRERHGQDGRWGTDGMGKGEHLRASDPADPRTT